MLRSFSRTFECPRRIFCWGLGEDLRLLRLVHLCNKYFMFDWAIRYFHIISYFTEFFICELLLTMTLCDAYHKVRASHWRSILDISGLVAVCKLRISGNSGLLACLNVVNRQSKFEYHQLFSNVYNCPLRMLVLVTF